MSLVSIRAALETALATVGGSLATAWENVAFTPVAGTPYQIVNLMPAEPDNPEMGSHFKQERGILQVTLRYPGDGGPGDAAAQAELIKAVFYRTATFTAGGIAVTIERTPWVGPGAADGDRWAVPIRIRFYSNISS